MLSDVEEGKNLMLTRLTPMAAVLHRILQNTSNNVRRSAPLVYVVRRNLTPKVLTKQCMK